MAGSPKFEVERTHAGRFVAHLVAQNGTRVASTPPQRCYSDAAVLIETIRFLAPDAPVEDLTREEA